MRARWWCESGGAGAEPAVERRAIAADDSARFGSGAALQVIQAVSGAGLCMLAGAGWRHARHADGSRAVGSKRDRRASFGALAWRGARDGIE